LKFVICPSLVFSYIDVDHIDSIANFFKSCMGE